MQVRQRKDTFIRQYGEMGYITNQVTKKDRVYDASGAAFLSTLSRELRGLEDITVEAAGMFDGVSPRDIRDDVYEFIKDLEKEGFLVTGRDREEVDGKDQGFTYRNSDPKTIALKIHSRSRDEFSRPSNDVMIEYFRDHPTIFGAHLEVTSRCNEKCRHCYQTHRAGRHAELDMIIDIMDQLSDIGTVSMTISGGEPFLHPDFPEILRQARRHDYIVNILSNGMLLTSDIVEAIREANINMIQISLYSMEPGIHDAVTRTPGSHGKTLRSIETLIENEIPVQISCPMIKTNKHSYRDVSEWCHKHKIRVLTDFVIMARSDFDVSNLDDRLDMAETGQVIEDIIEVDGEYQLLLEQKPKTRDLERYAKMPVCGVGVDNICFTADGSVYPCSGFQSYILGNVRRQSVRDIWENSERIAFLRSITNASFPKCLACDARDYCIMCLVRNYNESDGDMFRVNDHFCKVAFLNKELVENFRADRGGAMENSSANERD